MCKKRRYNMKKQHVDQKKRHNMKNIIIFLFIVKLVLGVKWITREYTMVLFFFLYFCLLKEYQGTSDEHINFKGYCNFKDMPLWYSL